MTYRTTNIITHPAFDPRSSATRQSAFFGSSLRASPILSAAELRKIIIQQLGGTDQRQLSCAAKDMLEPEWSLLK